MPIKKEMLVVLQCQQQRRRKLDFSKKKKRARPTFCLKPLRVSYGSFSNNSRSEYHASTNV